MRVLGISGSLRSGSYNTSLLRAVAEAPPPGIELELYDRLADIPPYDEDVEQAGEDAAVADLRDRVAAADAVMIATPEYNGSIPGCLKNALDWLSRPVATSVMRGKPVLVVGTSTGSFGAIWAQSDLRKVLGVMGARALDIELPIPYARDVFEDGRLADEGVRTALLGAVAQLAANVEDEMRVAA